MFRQRKRCYDVTLSRQEGSTTRHLASAHHWAGLAGGDTGRLFLTFGGPVRADRISYCPLDRVLTYKNLIYLLNLQVCIDKIEKKDDQSRIIDVVFVTVNFSECEVCQYSLGNDTLLMKQNWETYWNETKQVEAVQEQDSLLQVSLDVFMCILSDCILPKLFC